MTLYAKKIYIVGVGRSGTTMLQAMLASHAEIYFLPETGFFRRYVMERALSEKSDSQRIELLENDQRMERLQIDLSATLGKASGSPNVELAFYNSIFEVAEDSRFVGDKDPKNVEHIEPISQIWPDAKIVHIYRDPRDILASKKKAAWSKDKSLFFHLVAGAAQFALARDFKNPSSVYHLQYESLLRDQTAELKKLCDWLSISFDSSMENFSTEAKRLVSSDEMQWKGETLGPLLKNNSGKWKDSLTAMEVVAVETVSVSAMTMGSYQKAGSQGMIATIVGKALGLTAKFAAFVYCRKRKWANQKFIGQLAE